MHSKHRLGVPQRRHMRTSGASAALGSAARADSSGYGTSSPSRFGGPSKHTAAPLARCIHSSRHSPRLPYRITAEMVDFKVWV